MKKLIQNKSFLLLLFLGLFSFAIGLFSNYRELWLSSNNLSARSIANIFSLSSLITVFVFFFFPLKVSSKKLKEGISTTLVLKMIVSTILVCLNGSNYLFLIKFLMFFDIAFNELILASIYPLMITISKSDVMYTRKDTIGSLFKKIGFFIVSLLVGRSIGSFLFDYNKCLLFSIIFTFLSFIVLLFIETNKEETSEEVNLSKAIEYLNNHKIFYEFLISNVLSSMVWATILGMPLLSLTKNLDFSTRTASLIILILGIITNFLAMIVVKYLKNKNDNINMIFKYGIRIILYLLVFITNSKILLIATFIYLLLLDIPYGFIFNSYFIKNIPNKYAFLMTTLRYCSSLIGDAIGVFICGLIFNFDIRFLTLPALIFGIIHYIIGTHLINIRDKIDYKE